MIKPYRPAVVATSQVGWDAAVRAAGGSLLQSWEWGELHRRHGFQVERVRVDRSQGVGMAQILFRHRGPVSVAYLPRGPIFHGDVSALAPALFAAIDQTCVRHRALTVTIEPDVPLPHAHAKAAGLVEGGRRWHHNRTVKVPLLCDQELLSQMQPETRRKIRRAQRHGVVVEQVVATSAALNAFYQLLQDTARRNGFRIDSRSHYEGFMDLFGDDAVLLFAKADDIPAVGLITARFGEEAVDMYSASSTTHRVRGAADLLRFEAMRWAREQGCTQYNLWGIPAEDPPASAEGDCQGSRGADWRGLYYFKVGFGGTIITYPPTLERRYHPFLLRLARRMSWGKERVMLEYRVRRRSNVSTMVAGDS